TRNHPHLSPAFVVDQLTQWSSSSGGPWPLLFYSSEPSWPPQPHRRPRPQTRIRTLSRMRISLTKSSMDAETITDVCNSTDLPEFEIISLLEEQLPVYRLRADTVYGYDNDDWLHTPLVAPDAMLDLTTEQIEETLKYF
ncbi:hypothetical protein ATANTOWER_019039, partial [Ataeniobius toweri]|nr:hypothetical protein [Ataeniobius toweri]